MGEQYLTTAEAALILRRSVPQVRAYVRAGSLPSVRLAEEGRILIPRAALDKLLEHKEQHRA
jgi:excisionase family DNA binding protein